MSPFPLGEGSVDVRVHISERKRTNKYELEKIFNLEILGWGMNQLEINKIKMSKR